MAVRIKGIFDDSVNELINKSKILVVGAGGIGCELLKNLVLTGFEDLYVIDLDTIELSNLNRQFLFQKKHISRPKAVVAKESVQRFNQNAKITAEHDSIMNTKFDVEFFRQFTVVANALDNVAARTHVNRMCVAAEVPLVESGSAGYRGQVTVHKKGFSECYECLERKSSTKTYPGCTIRNTPTEPVHCIVWAKHLFNQLFGETDADEEVSPDLADPALGGNANETGNVTRISTRQWAKDSEFDPEKIFDKLFKEDIEYLLKMKDLWKQRKAPVPLDWNVLPDAVAGSSKETDDEVKLKDQVLWSIKECANVFSKSMSLLKERAAAEGEESVLSWDKDDDVGMDFVAAVANIRSHCFHIPLTTRFDAKSIAGNIVPAIASTNATIAGLVVLQVLKIVKGDIEKCRTAYLNEAPLFGTKIISVADLVPPNKQCFVCANVIPTMYCKMNFTTLTVKTLNEKILREKLHMAQPDIMFDGKVLVSSDPDDVTEELMCRTISSFDISTESQLLVEDFLQQYKLYLVILPSSDVHDQDFNIGDTREKAMEDPSPSSPAEKAKDDEANEVVCEDVEMTDEYEEDPMMTLKKKRIETENGLEPPAKKAKITVE